MYRFPDLFVDSTAAAARLHLHTVVKRQLKRFKDVPQACFVNDSRQSEGSFLQRSSEAQANRKRFVDRLYDGDDACCNAERIH